MTGFSAQVGVCDYDCARVSSYACISSYDVVIVANYVDGEYQIDMYNSYIILSTTDVSFL